MLCLLFTLGSWESHLTNRQVSERTQENSSPNKDNLRDHLTTTKILRGKQLLSEKQVIVAGFRRPKCGPKNHKDLAPLYI